MISAQGFEDVGGGGRVHIWVCMCVLVCRMLGGGVHIWVYMCVQDAGAGLVAAAMLAIVPGYISRSVAGSYDNEGIAIFCMLLTYYLWIKAVKTGSIYWSTLCALAYFYMVSQH